MYLSCGSTRLALWAQMQTPQVTGTPAFMSLAVMNAEHQSVSTELESLLYSMLYAATKGKLHWGGYLHFDPAAYDAKVAAMVSNDRFESKVVSRIDDILLRNVARSIRSLFFAGGRYMKGVQVESFVAAINQGQAASS